MIVEPSGTVEAEQLAADVRRRIADLYGLFVDDVVVAPGGTVGRTSSGKVQRAHRRVHGTSAARSGSAMLRAVTLDIRRGPARRGGGNSSGSFPPRPKCVVVGATRGAADDFVRGLARRSAATFGLTRFGLTELAARSAVSVSAAVRRAPATQAGAEAVAARAVFDAVTAGELEYFTPVASMPGFPRALARTLHELRLAGVGPDRLGRPDAATGDIGRLLARVEAELARVGVDDRAALFRRAAAAVRDGGVRWAALPIVLLDVPLDSPSDAGFVEALAGRAPDDAGHGSRRRRRHRGGAGRARRRVRSAAGRCAPRRRICFICGVTCSLSEPPPARDRAGDVRLFSAPGEGREAVEIVRRILDEAEARRAVRRDGRLPAHAAALSRTARARVRARRGARVLRSRHPAARIRPGAPSSRCCPARSRACRRGASTSICRSDRCRRSVGSRQSAAGSPSRSHRSVVPRDETVRGRADG